MLAVCAASTGHAQRLHELTATKQICEAGPDARVARAERLAGAAALRAARVLPNPSLVAEHQRTLSGASEQETIVGVAVPLPLNGRRGLLVDAADAREEQAQAVAASTLFESALEFRQAYAAAIADRGRVAALVEQQALLDALSATIVGLQKGGEAAQYDVLRQRVHARLHRGTLAVARARARASTARLEAWLGASVMLPETPLRELAGGPAGDAASFDGALAHHPELLALEAQARASVLEARAARRRWFPDLELFGGYRAISAGAETGHGFSLSLTVPLPFFDHGQGEAAQADSSAALATASAERWGQRHAALLQSASAQLESLLDSVAELEAARAEARELMEQTRRLYLAGEANLTELLDAFRAAEEARLGVIELDGEIVQVRLERMRAAGTLLDASLDEACVGGEERAR